MKVLYVDNNPLARRVIHKMLRVGGYEVAEAENPAAALEIASREAPDLILIDTDLNTSISAQPTSHLRADPALRMVPLIAVTTHSRLSDQDRLREAGYDAQLIRPVTMNTLAQTLSQFFQT